MGRRGKPPIVDMTNNVRVGSILKSGKDIKWEVEEIHPKQIRIKSLRKIRFGAMRIFVDYDSLACKRKWVVVKY